MFDDTISSNKEEKLIEMTEMKVVKRNGKREPLDLNKFHKMVEEACEGLTGVSVSQVELNSGIQFFNGITTRDIQNILIRSASDLISLETPNYQFVAARLILYSLYKDVYGQFEALPLKTMIETNISKNVYDKEFLEWYDDEEIEKMESFIRWDRDLNFTYAGLRQIVDKYLVQDRSSGEIFETPQMMYLMIAATLFAQYPKETRLTYVKKYYDAISGFKINLPTPVMGGVRTPSRQYASCVLIDVGDTLDSIFASASAVGHYTAQRAGIGLNMGRIRGIGSKIRGGEVAHTGVIPFLKVMESTVRSCTQNGIRGGSATTHFPIWHQEIEDILVLKNNKGTDDNRVRKLDYSITISKLFYTRFMKGEPITLFSPHDVPDLYDAYGSENFDELYLKYEKDNKITKKQISSADLFSSLIQERAETGRIYIVNIDHFNTHSSFKDQLTQSNLCQEISLPTKPIQRLDDEEGEIATCILSAINLGKIRNLEEMEETCDLIVRGLEETIDLQDYPVKAAEIFTKTRRALGVGYIGVAHYLAKHKVKYDDPEAWKLMHETTEAFQYYLLKSSLQLAKERGACEKFYRTKYADGLLPIDHYKKELDNIVPNDLKMDWEWLRSEIKEHGLRHSTLSAIMPSESSSVTSNATNGIEPPRDFLSIKKSKKGPLKQIVPQYQQLKNFYTLLWDMPNMEGYMNVSFVIQKFIDQAMSVNTSYNPTLYENNEIPMSVFLKDLLTYYKYGGKTLYYHNTMDSKQDYESDEEKLVVSNQDQPEEDLEEEACDSCTI